MDMEFMYFKTTKSTSDWKTWLRKVAERAKNTQKAMSTKLSALNHGPSQSGPYSRVRDLLATFALNFSLIAK